MSRLFGIRRDAPGAGELFDQSATEGLTAAIDRLNSRYGRGTINYGSSIPEMPSKISFQRLPKLEEF